MIPRYVAETAEQLASESPVNYAIIILYFAIITIASMWVINRVFKNPP